MSTTGRYAWLVLAATATSILAIGCGDYPAPIRSDRDIKHVPASKDDVVILALPLKDWPKLQKFAGLEHLRVAGEMARQMTDSHAKVLARLNMSKLRDVSFAHCGKLTDEGIEALTNVPSITALQLIGVSITDHGMEILASRFPQLTGINIVECRLLTAKGLMSLTNSKTITSVSMSFAPFSQDQLESIIRTVPNVSSWTINDPGHYLNHESLRQVEISGHITIDVVDQNNVVRGLTTSQPDGAANRSQPVRPDTNRTSAAAGSAR
jgi:hypothetical protein